MASFPNAVKTFTSKVDGAGNTIFAAHVNDLQDEVNAIEDGIRNGTAPLNSSNSTFTNLSITGNSTFTGPVTLSTNLTLSTSAQFTATGQPGWHLYSTAIVTGTAGSTTSVPFETEVFDQGGFHSTTSNPDRVTVPAGSSGLYLVGITGLFLTLSAAFNFNLTKNSSRELRTNVLTGAGNGNTGNVGGGYPIRLDAADILRAEIAGPGSTWSAGAALPEQGFHFWGVKVS